LRLLRALDLIETLDDFTVPDNALEVRGMRFGALDIPTALLDAQRQGSLVIFAGAGVSIPPPSSLPSFLELATLIAQGLAGSPTPKAPLDRFLGELAKKGVPVKHRAKDFLDVKTSKPSALHKALLRLFKRSDDVRVVTTNFDLHFSTAAFDQFASEPEEFHAPALPLGSDARGIIYLHGALSKELDRIVITDEDFGKAYLTQGWATRFLKELFETYTVLFVGYSHEDPVMNYIARGLPPSAVGKRFIITENADAEHWKFLGIESITHDDHAKALVALEELAQHCNQQLDEHDARIRSIVSAEPPIDEATLDYIRFVVASQDHVQLFVRHATSSDWLHWLHKNGYLKCLFESRDLTKCEIELAEWVVKLCVCQFPQDVFRLIVAEKYRVGDRFWHGVCMMLIQKHKPAVPDVAFATWVSLLLQTAPPQANLQLLDYLLGECKYPQHSQTASQIFAFLTRPLLRLEDSILVKLDLVSAGSERSADVFFPGEDHWLGEAWDKLFKPNLGAFADLLFHSLVANLDLAYMLLRSSGRNLDEYELLTRRRSLIRPGGAGDNGRGDGFHSLIEALRDIAEHYGSSNHLRLKEILDWSRKESLFQRIAVHTVTESALSPSERLDWLLNSGLLFDPNTDQEIGELLKVLYPTLAEPQRKALLARVEQWEGITSTDSKEQEIAKYAICSTMEWLQRASPSCPVAQQAFEKAKQALPSYQSSSHFESQTWSVGGWRSLDAPPFSTDDLLSMKPAEAIDTLLTWKPEGDRFGRYGLLDNVEKATAKRPDWGFELLDELRARSALSSDLVGSIVKALRDSSLSEEEWKKVLSLANAVSDIDDNLDSFVDFLLHRLTKKDGIPEEAVPSVFETSEHLWTEKAKEAKRDVDANHWYLATKRHPGAAIVEIWVHTLSRVLNGSQTLKNSLDHKNIVGRLEEVLAAEEQASELGRTVIASQVRFFHAVMPEWCESKLFPLFQWKTNETEAARSWQGYLARRSFSPAFMKRFFPFFKETCAKLDHLGDEREAFPRLIAGIAFYGEIDQVELVSTLIANASIEDRVDFAQQVEIELRELDDPTKVRQWNAWMRRYWQARVDGVPRNLETSELLEMFDWLLELQPVAGDVAEMICVCPAPDTRARLFLRNLSDSTIPSSYPEKILDLLNHLLPPLPDHEDCDVVEKMGHELLSAGASRSLAFSKLLVRLCDTIANKKCPGGVELLRNAKALMALKQS
jgi:hypothetical protein